MYDSGKVLLGILVFLGVVGFPFWYTYSVGDAKAKAGQETPQGACVEDATFMRAYHMDLLNQWRDSVVRDGQRYYIASDGKKHQMSLSYKGVRRPELSSHSCMECHTSKAKFCDKCHDYTGVAPYCWECHVQPEGER